MWLKWLPWRFLASRAARARGFVDPVNLLARLYRFTEPSEVAAPIELLRAGVVFHARGLINTRAIQHNLDWVWPYWVERQFNPADPAFIPRSFSVTHVNLTCRNWTAVGQPDVDLLPIVDPAGLLTPHWDGWSLDAWVLDEQGARLVPSQHRDIRQQLELSDDLSVITTTSTGDLTLTARSRLVRQSEQAICRQTWTASSRQPGWLVVSLRPYNPEGVSFVHRIAFVDRCRWMIEDQPGVEFSEPVERHHASRYKDGDVWLNLLDRREQDAVECEVGLATAAAMFSLQPGRQRTIQADIPLCHAAAGRPRYSPAVPVARVPGIAVAACRSTWTDALAAAAKLQIPDKHLSFLYEAALWTLVLHTPGEVYPGPYTYKRFWVRDTAFILNAVLAAGLIERAERALPHLLARQTKTGYFLSQEGEWDANGEALWIFHRFGQLAGRPTPAPWREAIIKAGRWIVRKRLPDDLPVPHAGLLPAGFSAEHLGPNDYYYWDDFWGVAGLRAAAEMLGELGERRHADQFRLAADDLMAAIDRSLAATADRRTGPSIPASPYRRMDSGAIGSVVAGYPLQLLSPRDTRLLGTVAALRQTCFVHGGFFQDMVHSGINAYLTLHLAQVLLRAGDPAWIELVRAVADLATSTGQWPEAIHPHTLGGCMGDGQHAWAAAEWVMAMRNAFVREEGDRLVLASGIPADWLHASSPLVFGPTPTPWGAVTVTISPGHEETVVHWKADWRGARPPIEVRLADAEPKFIDDARNRVAIRT